jgi:phosphopantothenoylcysteine decarboxylase/phosphopantothenate--cysteine ligase
MNDRMWSHAQTVNNVAQVRSLGYYLLEPDDGPLAVGEGSGPGRMREPEEIMAHVGKLLESGSSLAGRKVVVTAGATREPLDPVRFLSNHSSGKMGIAIARAAWRRGAEVTLVHGHVDAPVPPELHSVEAESVADMARVISDELPSTDVLVMAAAPADFRPAVQAEQKIKKGQSPPELVLEATEDILLSTIARRKKGSVMVGFALETNDGLRNATEKLTSKQLDFIVLNDATEPGAGFGVDTNRVTFIDGGGEREDLPLMPKSEVAEALLDRVEEKLRGR